MVGSMFLCLAAVAWATLKQMEGARDQLVSVLMLFLAGLNDVIASQWEIPWGLILPDCLFMVMVYGTWRESVRTGVTYRLSFEQAQRLSRLDTMKDDFLARVTHELRTPLHGILGLLTAFEQGDFGPLTPRQAFHQKMLQTSSRRLLKMVNSILDFSQLRGGILVGEFKVIALHPFVELLFEPFRAHLKPGVVLVNNVSVYLPAAWGEPGKVAQVVQNLLTNAIEHTTSGSITVEASVAQEKVILCVRDTGSGMADEILKNAFSPFEQSQDSDTRAKNGLGLGLAVSSGLMSQMGETLKLESEIGRGTRALLTLPLATVEQLLTKDAGTNWHSESETLGVSALFPGQSPPELFEEKAKEPPSQRARILVVDDEPVNLMLLQRFLVKMNYEVLVATNGPEALEVLKSAKVHLMVLDIMMPGMSGYEVTRLVRQTYSLAELPILLLTAKNNLNDQLRGLQMGANDFITKPFERDDLQTRLDFHLLLSTKSG
jgi:two-component system sensor histidine kinase ChiS